jgi:GT2 family glycosyltransferase
MAKPKILFCITAYNGRDFYERTLDSAVRIDDSDAVVDLLVLDDASPEAGFSDWLQGLCAERGVSYYRTPRNLGIPRNNNLGLKAAVEWGYDFAVISNSDVIYPAGVVSGLLGAYKAARGRVGSVTAWSNNVSIFALPNSDPDRFLADQAVVDQVSDAMAAEFRTESIDIPTGISFSMLFPAGVIREAGLMDPVFGRGYGEEVDWSCRAASLGYRNLLAPGVFVYHAGGGTNRAAGLIGEGQTTVPANEAIIDLRWPQYRERVGAFVESGVMERTITRGTTALLKTVARRDGYDVHVSALPLSGDVTGRPVVAVSPAPPARVSVAHRGFSQAFDAPTGSGIAGFLTEYFGRAPESVVVSDRGPVAAELEALADVHDAYTYPTRV